MNITVYQVEFYDIQNDTMQRSRRWFTRKGAERVRGIVLEKSATTIDDSELEPGEPWTPRAFKPHRTTGFQRQVSA